MDIRATAIPDVKVLTPRRRGDQRGGPTWAGDIAAALTREWPTPQGPANSVLDCAAIAAACGIARPDWRPALDGVIAELAAAAA